MAAFKSKNDPNHSLKHTESFTSSNEDSQSDGSVRSTDVESFSLLGLGIRSPASTNCDEPNFSQSVLPRFVEDSLPTTLKNSNVASYPTFHHYSNTSSQSDILQGGQSSCPPFRTFPVTSSKEPFRDFSGNCTLHRICLLTFVVTIIAAFMHLRSLVFPKTGIPSPWSSEWWAQPLLSVVLILPVMHYGITFIGALLFYYDTELDMVASTSTPVVWRIVSRGFNSECLLETISRCREEMRRNPLFPFLIEVVTDGDTFVAPKASDVVHLTVPQKYETQYGTLFKARALHYACQFSVVPDEAWVVHLDEETRPTSSGIKGIASFISECERKCDFRRIGQGIILYHRSWRTHPLLTLADMARTGEDIGSFYLQNRIGYPFVGLHGAYIVCRQKEERKLGFDLGADGSITEDCWWMFSAAQKGFKLQWVHGYLEEQSTESLMDFLKQRRRWMVGLLKVMRLHPTSLSVRGMFILLMTKWIFAPIILPIQFMYVAMILVHRIDIPYVVALLGFFNIAMVFYPYLIGWCVNLTEGMDVRKVNVLGWTLVLVALVPVFQFLELFALTLSFVSSRSAQGFHVVEKSATESQRNSVSSSMASMPCLPSSESCDKIGGRHKGSVSMV